MADLTDVVKYFPTAHETFSDNLSGSISALATTVPVTSASEYDDGTVVVLTVDPSTANEATFTGEKASSPDRFINCVWTEGNLGVGHTGGATIIDYVSATHLSMISKGIKEEHHDNGTHGAVTADSVTTTGDVNVGGSITADEFVVTGAGGTQGWEAGLPAPTTIAYVQNRSYTMTFNGTDVTDTLSPGMRLRTTRTTTAPVQCADLELSSTQYFAKTSPNKLTFVDDFVVSAWVKLESYPATRATVASRWNGTSGWRMGISSTGVVEMVGYNAGGANFVQVLSYVSVALGKWVHIAAQLDMSSPSYLPSTCYILIDGARVPGNTVTGGTAPATLIQAGNLEIGSENGGAFSFDGKLAQVAIYNAKVSSANVKATISQGLVGTETSLDSAYSLSNSLADLNTTTPNDLTASGGAVTTDTDSPFSLGSDLASGYTDGTVDFGIITKTAFSTDTTLTVQVPEGCTIPTDSSGVSTIAYSSESVPYGFPRAKGKWSIRMLVLSTISTSGTTTNTTYNPGGFSIDVPTGAWTLRPELNVTITGSASTPNYVVGISTSPSAFDAGDSSLSWKRDEPQTNTSAASRLHHTASQSLNLSAPTSYYVLLRSANAFSSFSVFGQVSTTAPIQSNLIAELEYV